MKVDYGSTLLAWVTIEEPHSVLQFSRERGFMIFMKGAVSDKFQPGEARDFYSRLFEILWK
ncbi:hypothetical protein N9911_01170 [Akkermansiaceae bacterium]|nr:hypothetical protein [Akkermansiaceae bacterium]MDC0322991.1 hypothetical protein [Akkermansiaceae bacterium]